MSIFLFSGQGSQFRGMGKLLFKKFPRLIEKANDALDYSIEELCLEDKNNQLNNTQYTQPAIFIINSFNYLEKYYETAKKPDYVLGHSLGEYVALYSANVFDFETGVKLVKKRGELMAKIQNGTMAAIVGLDENKISSIIKDNTFNSIEIANNNSPTQVVISGSKEEIQNAQQIFEKAGASMYALLKVSGPFHSSHMSPVKEKFKKYIENFNLKNPEIPVIANTTSRPYNSNNIIDTLVDQVTQKVRWKESIQYLLEKGEADFVEICPGPKKTLTKLFNEIQKEHISTDTKPQ